MTKILFDQPMQMPRPHHQGEQAFFRSWRFFAQAKPHLARDAILGQRCSEARLNQRQARVAASFMVWMGNNNGYSLRELCRRRVGSVSEYAWNAEIVAAWGVHNKRIWGVNSGLRCVEFMLARNHPKEGALDGGDCWQLPTITLDDLDVVESMLVWIISDPEGQRVCRESEIEADAERRKTQEALYR